MCPYRWFYIVVVPVAASTLRRWENPEDMDLDEVSVYQRVLLNKQHHDTKYHFYAEQPFLKSFFFLKSRFFIYQLPQKRSMCSNFIISIVCCHAGSSCSEACDGCFTIIFQCLWFFFCSRLFRCVSAASAEIPTLSGLLKSFSWHFFAFLY